jgi:hypothetical protein
MEEEPFNYKKNLSTSPRFHGRFISLKEYQNVKKIK